MDRLLFSSGELFVVLRGVVLGVTLVAMAASSGCDREREPLPAPLGQVLEAQREAACPCFWERMGFVSAAECESSYVERYLGLSEETIRCHDELVEGAYVDVETREAIACRRDAEAELVLCLETVDCGDVARFDECEVRVLEALAACPPPSEDVAWRCR